MDATPRLARLGLAAALAFACAQGTAVEETDTEDDDGSSSGGETCATKVCGDNATCDDTSGTAVCTCNQNYVGDGETCELDECAAVPGVCGDNATCVDTADGHTCTCDPGFELQGGACVKPGGCDQTPCADGCTCDDSAGTALCSCSLTQSTSQTIEPGTSASCNSMGIEHAENSYYRIFDLALLGVTAPFTVTSVEVGFEQVQSNVGSQSATLRLHTLNGAISTANLTQITSSPVTVLDSAGPTIVEFPIGGMAPAASKLVVEFYTPDGAGLGNLIFVGANSQAEASATYIRAPSCMLPEPVTTASINFPNMHWVVNVKGSYSPGG